MFSNLCLLYPLLPKLSHGDLLEPIPAVVKKVENGWMDVFYW